RNFVFRDYDVMMVFSTSGNNGVVVDVALGAKARGLKVVAVVALEYARMLPPGHSSGKRLHEIADVVIDNCAIPGDAMVEIEGLDVPIGPGSTIGNTAVVNAIKCLVAAELTRRGQPPLALAGAWKMGKEASARRFEEAYDDHRERVKVVYGG
ncbi:MAG: SIS domain-containing protein, partial [Meiothermus sp.]